MAFKRPPNANYDAGKDLLDQIPPWAVGAVIGVLLLVFFIGVFRFLRSTSAPAPESRQATGAVNSE